MTQRRSVCVIVAGGPGADECRLALIRSSAAKVHLSSCLLGGATVLLYMIGGGLPSPTLLNSQVHAWLEPKLVRITLGAQAHG